MKHLSILLALCFHFAVYAQKTPESKKEIQMRSEEFTQQLITLIEKRDIEALKKLTTPKLYCYVCFDAAPEKPPIVDQKTFYTRYLIPVFNKDLMERLKRKEIKFSVDKFKAREGGRDYIVLYTIDRPNELGDGHEGVQFIFWLKDEKDGLKFSGLETVP
ncbi:hypothetical protein ACQ7CX_12085 [Chryseobacterium arthrosphaerae]|uniref:hypothetical protein n=1 Tax=Chryseobacterium arthrosphaerae TaxID=651561 RepID=UPI001BAF5755|nr:hypothetical protein [Chryseobacterium arthrosphaerae]QUY54170.1 hypothetical protein I2F65_14905 [Chryseobacterium arthrosphaerae]